MLSTLFGKKAKKNTTTDDNSWDEFQAGTINVRLWRLKLKDGRSRFTCSLSRPYEVKGVTNYAKTFGIENLWDIIRGLEEFALRLLGRQDVSDKDRELIKQFRAVMERALDVREALQSKQANGHDEPGR